MVILVSEPKINIPNLAGAHTFYLIWRSGVSGVRTTTPVYILHLSLSTELSSRRQNWLFSIHYRLFFLHTYWILYVINCIENFMYFFMLNGKTLSTVLNKLCKKNIMILLISIFLVLNKRTLYILTKRKNVILILSNKIIN